MVRLVPKNLLINSRKLRREQTPWENKLWYYLRAKRFFGLKFKRQVRIEDYIVDFCCDEFKLVIELDGGQHNEYIAETRDGDRTKFLETQGYKILRFWNNEIDQNTEGVLERIKEAIKK